MLEKNDLKKNLRSWGQLVSAIDLSNIKYLKARTTTSPFTKKIKL